MCLQSEIYNGRVTGIGRNHLKLRQVRLINAFHIPEKSFMPSENRNGCILNEEENKYTYIFEYYIRAEIVGE